MLSREVDSKAKAVNRIQHKLDALVAAHRTETARLNSVITDLEQRLSAADTTASELHRAVKAAEMRLYRFQQYREDVIALEVSKRTRELTTFRLKDCDGYTDEVRDLGVSLMSLASVPSAKVGLVIELVAQCAGLTVIPSRYVSQRTTRRWQFEMEVIAQLQAASLLGDPRGVSVYQVSRAFINHGPQ